MDALSRSFEERHRRRWSARWIWDHRPGEVHLAGDEDAAFGERWVAFRKVLSLPDVPPSVPARLFADGRFVCWVNGAETCRGPARALRGAARYVAVDLAPFLQPGRNVIAVVVHHPGRAMPWWVPEQPVGELGRGAFAMEVDLAGHHVGTDTSWRCSADIGRATLHDAGIRALPAERIALRRAPGWTLPDYDASEWSSAIELDPRTPGSPDAVGPPSPPYGPLLPPPSRPADGRRLSLRLVDLHGRHIPPRLAEALSTYLGSVPPIGLWMADAEHVTVGTVEIDGSATADFRFVLVAGELRDGTDLGADLLALGDGGPGRFHIETFHPRGFRMLAMAVATEGAVAVDGCAVVERFSVPARTARFACSDPRLVQIFEAGRATVDRCALDTYVDCPTREQRAWSVDPVVQTMVDLATSDRWDLPRWSLELRSTPRPDGMLPMVVASDLEGALTIPAVVSHQLRALRELWWYTGDRALIADLLPAFRRSMRTLATSQRSDGLLWDVPGWNFIDWAAVETSGASSILNGLWGRALLDLTELADAADDRGTVAWARARHAELCRGFERFWDRRHLRYRDHLNEDGSSQASQHGQAAAIVGGLVPADRLEALGASMLDSTRIVEARWGVPPSGPRPEGSDVVPPGTIWRTHPDPWWNVDDQLVAAQPFFRYVVHDAAVAAGRPGTIPGLCLDWSRLLDRGGSTLPETWETGTTCHGWSATPTRDLVTATVGVRPAVPGFTAAAVRPHLGILSWVSATLPHPAGDLTVEVSPNAVSIRSPVPVRFDPVNLWGGSPRELPPGRHRLGP